MTRVAAFASLLIFTAQAIITGAHWVHDSPLNPYATAAYQQTEALWLLGMIASAGWLAGLRNK